MNTKTTEKAEQKKKVKILVPGSSNADLTGFAPRLPTAGETVMGSSLHIGIGGKGCNQMTAAARAGADAWFITRVGRDVFGETLRRHFAAEGFRDRYIRVDETAETGCALIEIDERDGQNRIMVIPGANRRIGEADVRAAAADFADADAVLTQLETDLSAVEEAKRQAQAAGVPFLLNPAPWQPLPEELLRGTDWFTPNETEAGGCTGTEITDDASVRRAARILLDSGIRNVVITLGVRGVYWTDGARELTVPGIPVKAVETTGAGDTFNGALAVAVAEGRDPAWAIRFANAAAALSVTRMGAAVSAPHRDEILDMMQRQYGISE
jgi:ribokinase